MNQKDLLYVTPNVGDKRDKLQVKRKVPIRTVMVVTPPMMIPPAIFPENVGKSGSENVERNWRTTVKEIT